MRAPARLVCRYPFANGIIPFGEPTRVTKWRRRKSLWLPAAAGLATLAPAGSTARRQAHRLSEAAQSELAGCANRVISIFVSPDGRRQAVIFERDCGATTGFSTQVSVLPRWSRLRNVAGNILIADSDHGAAPEGPGGGPRVDVAWEGRTKLLISFHRRARVFRARHRMNGVSVRYLMQLPVKRRGTAGSKWK